MTTAKKTVFLIPGAFLHAVETLFDRFGFTRVDDPHDAETLVWLGGCDINPQLYKERVAGTYGWSEVRDARETQFFHAFKDKKKVGICRGAQLLTVLSGGSLWQDCNGHGNSHRATDHLSNQQFVVSSLHHQMMRPTPETQILLTAKVATYVEADGLAMTRAHGDEWDDIEATWVPSIQAVCYQGHPEIGSQTEQAYFMSLLYKFHNA